MFRVLRPGGVLTLSTEFRLAGPPPGLPGTLLLDERELLDAIVGDLNWSLLSRLDLHIDDETLASSVPFAEAAADVRTLRDRWTTYPHIVLHEGEHRWTSIHIALVKSGSSG